jgi:hypothetical protein
LDHPASSIEKQRRREGIYTSFNLVYEAGGGGSQTSRRPIEGIILNLSTEEDSDNLGKKGKGGRDNMELL